jgi:hypothetical protein
MRPPIHISLATPVPDYNHPAGSRPQTGMAYHSRFWPKA